MSFRQTLNTLPPNPGAEMLRYGWRRPDILSLGQGEGSRATPGFINEAAQSALESGRTFYGPVLGLPELRQEISEYYRRIYHTDILTDRIFVTGSGTTAMNLALTSILEHGDEVVALTPIWKNLLGSVHLAEANTVQVPLDYIPNVGWQLDLDKFFAAVTDKTKALLFVTPNNPTGWMMSEAEIKAVLAFARERGIWIISDEVYGRITYDRPSAPSFLEQATPNDKLYIVNSFSKTYAMTGWRLGWLIGPSEAASHIRDVALYDNMGPPTFLQYGAIAALRDGEAFIAEQIEQWRDNREYLTQFFAAHPDIDYAAPDAAFYAFFANPSEPDCMTFGRRLIDEVALSLAPGCSFGASTKGYTRLCFAVEEKTLSEALDRLARSLK